MLTKLEDLRSNLQSLMDPKLLSKFADLLKAFGDNNSPFSYQYKTWIERNGKDCRYAAMAKKMFEMDCATNVANAIIEIYHSWAKLYEKGEK